MVVGDADCVTHHCGLQCPSYKWGAMSSPQMQYCQLQQFLQRFPRNRSTFPCKKHLVFDANWTEEHVCTSSLRAVQYTRKGAVDLTLSRRADITRDVE